MSEKEIIALECDPFDGDFGQQEDRILKDKIVTTRINHKCSLCSEAIKAGQRARAMTAIFDSNLMRYYWHIKCLQN